MGEFFIEATILRGREIYEKNYPGREISGII